MIKILLGEVQPDFGEVKLGSNLIIAKFDQMREQLNLENSLLQNLTDDPNIQSTGTAGQILGRGKPKHVAGYLKDFLFSEAQLRSPVKSLSGGEKALTALALVFAFFELNPAPFCLLDEVDAPLDDLNTLRFIDMVEDCLLYTSPSPRDS